MPAKTTDVTLTTEQRSAADSILSWYYDSPARELVMGGLAGTGKTTVVSAVTWEVPAAEAVAYTAKAVAVLKVKCVRSARTLHSVLYQLIDVDEEKQQLVFDDKDPDQATLQVQPLVIVDEASMVTRKIRQDLLRRTTAKILYVGDHGQLEPIGDDDEGVMKNPDITLKKVMRQGEGSGILEYAYWLRSQKGRHCPPPAVSEDVTPYPYNHRSGLLGAKNKVDVYICGFNKTRIGQNRFVRAAMGYHGDLPHPGERLICLKNDYELGVYNGQILEVTHASAMDGDPGAYWLEAVDASLGTAVSCVASKRQLNSTLLPEQDSKLAFFDYAYAITCHKAQGSEWDNVAVIAEYHPNWDMARWRYTAATRAAKHLYWIVK